MATKAQKDAEAKALAEQAQKDAEAKALAEQAILAKTTYIKGELRKAGETLTGEEAAIAKKAKVVE